MALTVAQLAVALRLAATDGQGNVEGLAPDISSRLTRLNSVAEVLIDEYAATAPDVIKEEANILFSGYQYDKPSVTGMGLANAFHNSGAAALLAQWHEEHAATIEALDETSIAPVPQNTQPAQVLAPAQVINMVVAVSADANFTASELIAGNAGQSNETVATPAFPQGVTDAYVGIWLGTLDRPAAIYQGAGRAQVYGSLFVDADSTIHFVNNVEGYLYRSATRLNVATVGVEYTVEFSEASL